MRQSKTHLILLYTVSTTNVEYAAAVSSPRVFNWHPHAVAKMPRSCDDTPLGHVDFQHGSMFSSIRRLVSNVHYLNPNCRCKKGLHAVWMAGALLYGLNPLCCGTCGRACAWELYSAISVMKWWGSDTQILLLRWWMRQWRWMGGWVGWDLDGTLNKMTFFDLRMPVMLC